ncbi:unnamed protein product [Prunus armeniaca]|uniref:Reverse transcriptase domain-containing protein n=1 Tax=Prunus armeniaca TaxID=36596 RepID=A0A6J5WGT8_PRUAR|nr:unnamed protein product [Prunus armeniaca]
MHKLGFNEIWIQRALMCVSTISYFFVINGEAIGYLHPSRGLCQGGPLSPYPSCYACPFSPMMKMGLAFITYGCESTVHLLCDCIFAEGVWHCLSSFNYNKVYHSELAKEWVHSHRYLLSPADFATFLMLGWAIWEVKNALVWEAKQSRPEQVYINAVTRLQDFLKVNTRAPKSIQQPIGGVK